MEMNMHMAQNVMAETELRHLAAIPYQIISPAANSPIIGIYQDSLLGSYRMTRKNVTFSPSKAMDLLMMYPHVNTKALRDAGKKISSFEVLSQIMPPLTMVYKTKLFEDGEEYKDSNNVLEIRNGKYTRGQLEKSVLGSTTKGILHRVFNDYGPKACADFNDNLQNVVTEYMKSSAYSVGVSDLIADKVTQEKIIQVITTQKTEVQALIDKVHLGAFENTTANTNIAEFETSVNNILNKATEQSGKIGRISLDPNNRFLMIVNSGSKGSLINISQMISCLGQQNVDGKRIPYGFDSRTLPHYNKFDDSPNARGFIENSYISGLTAPELFFHAMGGRIGLIDTAVKTSQTGYIQRRLIKGLEDLKVEYDMTVRNNMGKIIQFAYGDDGFDSIKVENQSIPLVGMSVEDIYMHFDIIGVNDQTSELLTVYTKSTASRIKKQKDDTKKKCQAYIDKMLAARDDIVKGVFNNKNDNNVVLPIALQNMIANIQGQLGLNSNSTVDITPLEAFELIEDNFKKMNQLAYAPLTRLFEIVYYYYLSPKELLVNKRFHRKGLVLLLDTICLKHKEALIHPGEMVGVIAGQSIGEPTTQLTLNSVTYETEILVRNANKEIKSVQIGDFTKWGIETSTKIDYMEDKDTTYAELSEYYEVPSGTEDGHTVWRRIEAVTRHPVINKDGTNTMLKVTTKGNREIIATKAKSFLQLIDGKIQGVNGDTLKVGDYLPVSKKALDFTENYDLDLRNILPPSEYVYGSDLEKAKSVMHEYHWWMKHANKTFTLPHGRSDSVVNIINIQNKKIAENNLKNIIRPGCVYMKLTNMCEYSIPEQIPLDYEFGYLVGAYLSLIHISEPTRQP
jgi:DNA-directed RNA polymerase II subunit RPB1